MLEPGFDKHRQMYLHVKTKQGEKGKIVRAAALYHIHPTPLTFLYLSPLLFFLHHFFFIVSLQRSLMMSIMKTN